MLSGVPHRATLRSRLGYPRPADRSVLLQDIPKRARTGTGRISAALIPRYLATPVFADSLFPLPLSRAIKHPPCDGGVAAAAVRTVLVRVRKLHEGVLQTVAHERCWWQVIIL